MSATELRKKVRAMEDIEEMRDKKRKARVEWSRADRKLVQRVVSAVNAGTLSPTEAANAAGVSRQTVHAWMKR